MTDTPQSSSKELCYGVGISEEAHALITAYGNANFDCGEWDDDADDADFDEYKVISERATAAGAALASYIRKLQDEINRLRQREYVMAQNDETGRYWSGPREDIPAGFVEVPERAKGGPAPEPQPFALNERGMDRNRLAGMRQLERNLRIEGHTSRADCVVELCQEIERLQMENIALRNLAGNLRPGPISEALAGDMAEDYRRAGIEPPAGPPYEQYSHAELCSLVRTKDRHIARIEGAAQPPPPARRGCPDLDPDWPNILGEPRGPTLCVLYPNCKCGEEDRRASQPQGVDQAEREDMENIGRAFMERLHEAMPDYSWCDSPVEVIYDLINQRDEARAAQPPSADATDAARWRQANADICWSFDGSDRTYYLKAVGRESFEQTIDKRIALTKEVRHD